MMFFKGFCGELECDCGEHQTCYVDDNFNPYCTCIAPYIQTEDGSCKLPPYCDRTCLSCALINTDTHLKCVDECQCECKMNTTRANNNSLCIPDDPQYECSGVVGECGNDLKYCNLDMLRCVCIPEYYASITNTTTLQFDCLPIEESSISTCSIWGDPHYIPFHKKSFDYHGLCDHVLTSILYSNNANLTIYGRNQPCGRSVSCLRSIAI